MRQIHILYPIPFVLFALLLVTMSSLVGCSETQSQPTGETFVEPRPVRLNSAAPDFAMPWYGEQGNGRLADLKGKVVLVNFWASWCGPCKSELPDLVTLHADYQDRDFAVLGVIINSHPQEVGQVISRYNVTYPSVTANEMLARYWQVESIPTTYILDREGVVRYKYVGARSRSTLERDILRLLSES